MRRMPSDIGKLQKLKEINPNLKIHAFNLVARVAAYNNAHEDPDYWATQGWNIWRYTYLMDMIARNHAGDAEKRTGRTERKKSPNVF